MKLEFKRDQQSNINWRRHYLLYYFWKAGYGPLVVGGISMGGLHAAMVAALTPFPVGTASLVGPPSAVPVFTSVGNEFSSHD